MKKVKFIYNSNSGGHSVLQYLDEIIRLYQLSGYNLIPFRIDQSTTAEEVFSDYIPEYHHILIAGGDGTINRMINEIKRKDIKEPIAVLPAGTANDFAKMVGFSGDILEDVKKILKGSINPLDLVKVNDSYFINVLTCGLFTDVSQNTPALLKNNFGKMAYYITGIKEVSKFKRLHIEVKSEECFYSGTVAMLFVFNGSTAGNIKISYKSKLDDGLLDVILVTAEDFVSSTNALVNFLLGEHLDYPDGIIHFQTKALSIKSIDNIDIYCDVDGERGPLLPLDITCLPNALNIIF